MHRFSVVMVVSVAFSAAGWRARAEPEPAPPPALDVFFHADLNGQLAAPACGKARPPQPDYAALVAALVQARTPAPEADEATRPAVVLLGPNAIAPDLFTRQLFAADETRGAATIATLFRAAGYRAFTVGSRELGAEPSWMAAYARAMTGAGMPLVLSNVSCRPDAPDARAALCRAAKARVVIDVAGAGRVGVMAVLSSRLTPHLQPARREGLVFGDPVEAMRRETAALRRDGATRVLVLTEVTADGEGLDELRAWQAALGAGDATSRPDALLSAGLAGLDAARPVRLLMQDDGPIVVGSAAGPRGASRLSLGATVEEAEVRRIPAVASHVDEGTAEVIADWSRRYCQRYGQPLGPRARAALTRDAFVTYLLEVMRRAARAEVAIVNDKLVKATPFPIEGAIGAGELEQALPYRAIVGSARVGGAKLGATVGAALGHPRARVVGLAKGAAGLTVNGRPIDTAREYRVATIAFVAEGGDGILPAGALPWHPLPGSPDVGELVRDFVVHQAGGEDGDPSVDPAADFGPPASKRLLVVGLTDVGLDLAGTKIANGPQYTDAQLTRAQAASVKADWTSLLQLRAPAGEADGRLRLQYGWARTIPAGKPAVSAETVDLITAAFIYNDRQLRHLLARAPGRIVPDPFARVMLESELTRPTPTATQTRSYHHAELTATVGVLFSPTQKLRLRAGPGVRKELVAPGDAGRWRSVVEAGATLAPTALATVGVASVLFDAMIDYVLVAPTGTRLQQLRGNAHLSVPLLPRLFFSAGVDVYAAQYGAKAWAFSADTTMGLRVHLDAAHQRL